MTAHKCENGMSQHAEPRTLRLLAEIFRETERPDKIAATISDGNTLTVTYVDLDSEWADELRESLGAELMTQHADNLRDCNHAISWVEQPANVVRTRHVDEVECPHCLRAKLAAAAKALDAATLKWTDEPPTEPGWYWIDRPIEGPKIASVFMHSKTGKPVCVFGSISHLASHGDKFAGPIPEPEADA